MFHSTPKMVNLFMNFRYVARKSSRLINTRCKLNQSHLLQGARSGVMSSGPTNYFATLTAQTKQNSYHSFLRSDAFPNINLEQKRYKKKRANPLRLPKKGDKEDADEEEDSDSDDELSNENPLLVDSMMEQPSDGGEILIINVNSLRLDTFCKSAFAITRTRVEEAFYKNEIYINGELPHKKSIDLSIGDEIDFVKFINPENNKLINIKRAVVLKLPDKSDEHGRVKLNIKRWNDLVIDSPHHKEDKE